VLNAPDPPVYVKVGSARFFYCLFSEITPADRGGKVVFFPEYQLKRIREHWTHLLIN